MQRKIIIAAILLLFGALMNAGLVFCQTTKEIVVMTHDSFSASKPVIAAFEKQHAVKIKFLKAGDAGAALNQAILSKHNPLADIFFGVDNTYFSRALKADIFESYASPVLKKISPDLKLDPQNRLLPVDFGDVCLNYDKKWFQSRKLEPPQTLRDLTLPAYSGLTVVENPATSSPGLAFLLATISQFGVDGYLDFWKALKASDVLITDGWKKAYWGHFSAASDGDRPVVVSYASSPAAEVFFSKTALSEAPTKAITTPGSCFRQIEFVGILKGTRKLALAQKLIDYFLDTSFQEDIPLQMFVYPANRDARLPDIFKKHATTAPQPAQVDSIAVDRHREEWIENWTHLMLQ